MARGKRHAELCGSWWRHRKTELLSLEACGLWAKMLSYSSDNMTDGLVPDSVVRAWAGRRYKRLIRELTCVEHVDELAANVSPWVQRTGRYWCVERYTEHNISKSDWKRLKDKDAARKRASWPNDSEHLAQISARKATGTPPDKPPDRRRNSDTTSDTGQQDTGQQDAVRVNASANAEESESSPGGPDVERSRPAADFQLTPPKARLPPKPPAKARSSPADEQRVFDYWVKRFWSGKGRRPRLDAKRRKRIRARLKRFSVEELCEALDNVPSWYLEKKQTALLTLLRDDEQVEKFLGALETTTSDCHGPGETYKPNIINLSNEPPDERKAVEPGSELDAGGKAFLERLGAKAS